MQLSPAWNDVGHRTQRIRRPTSEIYNFCFYLFFYSKQHCFITAVYTTKHEKNVCRNYYYNF